MLKITSIQNTVFFKNEKEQNGILNFRNPVEENEVWKVTCWGFSTNSAQIPETTIQIEQQDTINPSKVAKAILKALAAAFNSNDAT